MKSQSLVYLAFVIRILSIGWLSADSVQAHEGHGSPAAAVPASRVRDMVRRTDSPPVKQPSIAPVHGGQLVEAQSQYFEVVYLPHETRVYVYAKSFRPLSPSEGGGEVLMQVRGNPQVFRNRLRYAAQPGIADEEYLVADVNVTQIHDGDMQVTFLLTGLPSFVERTAKFTHAFALSGGAAVVTVAQLTAADREPVARQGFCPVMAAGFDHGAPIKLIVGDQPLYVCCEGCIDAVKQDPQAYLQKVATKSVVRPAQSARPPQAAATRAADADRAAIQAQGICPVMNQPLGAHGAPWKMSVEGNDLFVCCASCIQKVQHDPQHYLAELSNLKSRR